MLPKLSEEQIKSYVHWGRAYSRVKAIMLERRKQGQTDQTEFLIEATDCIKQAMDLATAFPKNDLRRFLTISTAIALYCHLHHFDYVELDRQILLRMSKRFPRPPIGDLLNSLGMLYQEHGKFKEAAQMYKRAIKLLPATHPRFNLVVSNLESLNN